MFPAYLPNLLILRSLSEIRFPGRTTIFALFPSLWQLERDKVILLRSQKLGNHSAEGDFPNQESKSNEENVKRILPTLSTIKPVITLDLGTITTPMSYS